MSIPPVPVLIPKAELNEHPLYRRERGLHRPWMLRGRVPPIVALPLIAVLILIDAVFLGRSVRFPFDADFLFVGMYALGTLREVRVGLRMMELKTSGTYQELYLSVWSPVETCAAFVIGNRFHTCEYLLLAAVGITVAILKPEFWIILVIFVPFLLIMIYFSPLRPRTDSYQFHPAYSLWMLEAKDTKGLLVKGLRDYSWIFMIGIIPYFSSWGLIIWMVGFFFLISQTQKYLKIDAMTAEQLNNYLDPSSGVGKR